MDKENLLAATDGDKGLAVFVQDRLKELARGSAGPVWREIARDVLAGHVELRDAVFSEAYRDQVSRDLSRFVNWYADLSPEERRDVEAGARRHLNVLGRTRNLD